MLFTIKDRYAKAIAEPEHSFEYRAEAIADNGRQPPRRATTAIRWGGKCLI